MNFWVVIPSRRASTRLPDKALADIGGKPMVVRVAEQAEASGAQRVLVATDDPEIRSVCIQHGHEAIITRADHQSGTDRIAEVADKLRASEHQSIVNVQGDEPLIPPELICNVAQTLERLPQASVATAAAPILDTETLCSPHVIKVVCDAAGLASYFSRAPIPYQRDHWPSLADIRLPETTAEIPFLRHIGIYGLRAKHLAQFVTWPVCPTERAEQLEQLRWLWHGHLIGLYIADTAPAIGVDTADDLERVRHIWGQQSRVSS